MSHRMAKYLSVLLVLMLLLALLGPASYALTREQRLAAMKSTVEIIAAKIDGTKVTAAWSGSGTIIDPKGLILTNHHVIEASPKWNVLLVFMTTRSDRAPELMFRAKTVAQDPKVDLAVIRVVSDGKGNPVDPAKLNLPTTKLGNADDLEIGDDLHILGYPGAGYSTITLTQGKVSGFLPERGVTYQRAWIKTDASISGGNSGGAGLDDNSKLVGIPTRGLGVDLRPADTNGDGVIDERDGRVPVGGFINALRPINLAYPLIEQAQKAALNPEPDATPAPTPRSTGTLPRGARLSEFVFASKLDKNKNPVDPGTSFPNTITSLYAFVQYQNLADGVSARWTWNVDGQTILDKSSVWEGGAEGVWYYGINYKNGDPLPEGEYGFKLTVGDSLSQTGAATVGTAKRDPKQPPRQASKGVTLSGYLLDADTGEGLEGALLVILVPGVTVQQFLNNQLDEQIAAFGKTDGDGYYRTAPPLPRGETYSALAIAKGYQMIAQDDALDLGSDAPDEIEVQPIELTAK